MPVVRICAEIMVRCNDLEEGITPTNEIPVSIQGLLAAAYVSITPQGKAAPGHKAASHAAAVSTPVRPSASRRAAAHPSILKAPRITPTSPLRHPSSSLARPSSDRMLPCRRPRPEKAACIRGCERGSRCRDRPRPCAFSPALRRATI